MNKIIILICTLLFNFSVYAELKVVTTYQYITDIAKKIGKDRILVTSLAQGKWDPHYIVPKPSLIIKARQADLLIINGAELEIGWVPPIIRDSKNSKIQPGTEGFLDLSSYVNLIDKPENVSRAHGDVHPSGNPHYFLDPDNIPTLAKVICNKLSTLDNNNSQYYKDNLTELNTKWNIKIKEWSDKMAKFNGKKIIQYHKLFDYFCDNYNILIEKEIEPLPGIPPTSGHIKKVIELVKAKDISLLITDVYHSKKPVKFVSNKTKVKFVILPHDVNAVEEAKDIFSLFDEIIRRMTND